jgi:hypothetical protein
MKKSELRQLIREEISKVVNEFGPTDGSQNKLFKKGDIVYSRISKAKLKVTRIVKDRIYTVPFNFPNRAEEWYKAEDLQTKSFFAN